MWSWLPVTMYAPLVSRVVIGWLWALRDSKRRQYTESFEFGMWRNESMFPLRTCSTIIKNNIYNTDYKFILELNKLLFIPKYLLLDGDSVLGFSTDSSFRVDWLEILSLKNSKDPFNLTATTYLLINLIVVNPSLISSFHVY